MAVTSIPENYFDGQSNITKGSNSPATPRNLREILNEIITLVNSNEVKVNRSSSPPEITGVRSATGAPLKADGSENVTLLGTNLLQAQTFASVTLGASLEIIAEEPGTPGNAFSVVVVDSAGGGLAVTYSAGQLEIDLGGATPTEDLIATDINTAGTWTGLLRANSGGGPAFGIDPERSLTGGVGTGVTATIGGAICSPLGSVGAAATSTASLAETALILDVPNLTAATPALAADDYTQARVLSNGKYTQSGSILLEV